jgi:hypothetical protein
MFFELVVRAVAHFRQAVARQHPSARSHRLPTSGLVDETANPRVALSPDQQGRSSQTGCA